MSEYMLLFRRDVHTVDPEPTSPRMQVLAKRWQDWIGSVAAQNKYVSSGNRLSSDGKVVRPGNVVTDGPYVEIKEALAGYMIIRAGNYDDAVDIATGCPIVRSGGSVEVREFVGADGNRQE